MPKFISPNYRYRQNIFQNLWDWFSSPDKFTKISDIVLLLIITVVAVSSNTSYNLRSHANTQYPNYKGLCEFTGNNDSQNITSPYVECVALNFNWSDIESGTVDANGVLHRTYNWTDVESQINAWSTHGKKVILRIMMAGDCNSNLPFNCQRSPQFVLNEMQADNPNQTVAIIDKKGGIHAVYWRKPFFSEWQIFVSAFAAKYDGDPRIIAIDVVHGNQGEPDPDTPANWKTATDPSEQDALNRMISAWTQAGYTDLVWWSSLNILTRVFTTKFTSTPLAVQAGGVFFTLDNSSSLNINSVDDFLKMNSANDPQIWYQDDGLTSSTVNSRNPNTIEDSLWNSTSHIEEQLGSTKNTGDTLYGDVQNALNLGANYIFITKSDIDNSANQSTLIWATSLLTPIPTP